MSDNRCFRLERRIKTGKKRKGGAARVAAGGKKRVESSERKDVRLRRWKRKEKNGEQGGIIGESRSLVGLCETMAPQPRYSVLNAHRRAPTIGPLLSLPLVAWRR